MATQAEVAEHRQGIADLTTLAYADLVGAFGALDLADAAGVASTLNEAVPDLAATYGGAAGALAADWYDELRDGAEVRGSYAATVAEAPTAERLSALVGWAVGPLYGATPNGSLALSLLAGGLQRVIANQDRDTIEGSAQRDPADARWARRARPGACTFCLLLESRGAAFSSERSALTVGGAGTEQRPARLRGSQGAGAKYHDHCRCLSVPVWSEDDLTPPSGGPRVDAAYDAAYAAVRSENRGAGVSLQQVLAHMRTDLGTS